MHQGRLGIGGHQSAHGGTVEWLTPPEVLAVLGPFDLDPCSPEYRPWDTAAKHYTQAEDGLLQPWSGRVWLNPPYGGDTWEWLERLAKHGNGTALIFARTETEGFHDWGWKRATAMLFLRGRLNFHFPDGTRSDYNAGAPSVLIAYGRANARVLRECGLPGKYVRLR